jgi:hypothetical protein
MSKKIEIEAVSARNDGNAAMMKARLEQQQDEERRAKEAEEERVRLKRGTDADKKIAHQRHARDKKTQGVHEKQLHVRVKNEELETSHTTRRDNEKRLREEQANSARVSERAANTIPERDYPTNPFPE